MKTTKELLNFWEDQMKLSHTSSNYFFRKSPSHYHMMLLVMNAYKYSENLTEYNNNVKSYFSDIKDYRLKLDYLKNIIETNLNNLDLVNNQIIFNNNQRDIVNKELLQMGFWKIYK